MKGKFIPVPTVIIHYVVKICVGVKEQTQLFLMVELNGNERPSSSSVIEIGLQICLGNWASPRVCLDHVENQNIRAYVRNCHPARSLIIWKIIVVRFEM
jgi:hypothetical protein